MKNEERYYKRVESYYNTARTNCLYSVKMIDLIIVILPVLGIMYAVDLCHLHPDSLVLIYVSILMFMSTIGCNFIAHCCSVKCHHGEGDWAETKISKLNGDDEKDEVKSTEGWNTCISVFNYISFGFFAVSFVLFFMLVSL